MLRVSKEFVAVGADRVFLWRVEPPTGTAEAGRGTILVPPLIGGSGLQQYRYFREMSRAGYELALFDYRGHGRSSGRFGFRASMQDTLAVARHLAADVEPGSLLGMADCYGAMPLLRAADRLPGTFRALALFSPVPTLQHLAGPREVLRDFLRDPATGAPRLRNPLAWRTVLQATTERLFPQISQSSAHFGILRYENARGLSLLFDYLFWDPLGKVRVEGVPTKIVYGCDDELLGTADAAREAGYRAAFERMLDRPEFATTPGADHYWTGMSAAANAIAREFFARHAPAGRTLVPAASAVSAAGEAQRADRAGRAGDEPESLVAVNQAS